MKLYLAAPILRSSRVNGPGLRDVLHLQGCSIHCPGCFNPHTWEPGGHGVPVLDVVDDLLTSPSDGGLTISGGEPTDQFPAVLKLVDALHAWNRAYSVVMFTGRTVAELVDVGYFQEFSGRFDVVVAGPYDRTRPSGGPLLGSDNQRVLFVSDRYCEADLVSPSQVEVHIGKQGDATVTGFPTKQALAGVRRSLR